MSDTITSPVFSDTSIPSTLPRDPDANSEPDIKPDVPHDSSHELVCRVCGKELEYAGRGRKPTLCDDHKRTASGIRSGSASKGAGKKNEQLAGQAVEALCQMNGILGIGVMMLGLPLTATTLATAQDGFREQAYQALLTDPSLCALILKGGTGSGKIALLIAYGMLGSAVVPVAITEIREKREQAELEAGEDAA